jgi:hypothetical protein
LVYLVISLYKSQVISDYKVCQYPLTLAYKSVRIEPVEMLKKGLFVKRLNRTLQLHGQRVALAVNLFTHWHLDPPLANAVFLHIKALFVVEFDAHIVLKNSSHVEWTAGVGGEVVWESGFCGFGHGEIFLFIWKGLIFYYFEIG